MPLLDFADGPIIYNNIIRYNYANNGGGGIAFGHGGIGLLLNNIIYGNWGSFGGGLYNYGSQYCQIINCIFWYNRADSCDQIAYWDWGTWGVVIYCDVEGGYFGEGNINIDPLFVDAEADNFHLMSITCGDSINSPCIDAGRPVDFDTILSCQWGLGTTRSDMGSYGGGTWASVGIENESERIPQAYSLSQSYPNPFNAQTTISFTLPSLCHVNIDIYDILGRKVASPFDGDKPAGTHQVVWNASESSSGIYFYRIAAGDKIETQKMILLK